MTDALNKQVDQYACSWCQGAVIVGAGPSLKPGWKRYKCKKCGTISYLHLPDKSDLDLVYLSAWSAPQTSGAFAAGTTDDCISNSLLDAIAWDGKNKVCLDYGAGAGFLSQAIVSRGGNVVAVEPYGEETSLGQSGRILWLKSLESIPSETKFEWIFLVEVIEHMLDPVSELKKIRDLLLPEGKLVITTPNAKGWRARKDGFNWREAQNPTHITLFSGDSLEVCFQKAGFSRSWRVKKPVDYGKKGLSRLALAITQLVGVDGGLRYMASR